MPDPPSPEIVRVVGLQWAPHAHEVRDFLARNAIPYRWLDVERDREARELLERAGVGTEKLPVLFFPGGSHLAAPSDAEIAERIGHHTEAESPFYDLIVVGGGPAGLAAAVYGASEGLRTLIVEREAPGGQAGQSASIENYLGFPEGISGAELARRAVEQAERFGVEILTAREITGLRAGEPYRHVRLDGGEELRCYVVLLSLGVAWRLLEAPGCPSLTGAGVYYGAAAAEAHAARGQDVYLLGGGNSAGQAAMLLARYARSVTMLVLEDSIEERMSKYLVDRIRHTPNIRVCTGHTIEEAHGNGRLEEITIKSVETDERERVVAHALFVFIGAVPETGWLEGVVERDEQGFILCGDAFPREDGKYRGWPLEREPLRLETSLPGVFVAGDVRADSVKRVASAVGDGAIAVQFIHEYLGEH
jgi:thioredoxin reductase (NADPH)